MKIYLNGKCVIAEQVMSLEILVASLGAKPDVVVIEHNGRVLDRGDWDEVNLKDEDRLEIISFVGGG